MAKYALRIKARQMRSQGESVKRIASLLGVSRSTSSVWVRDIVMSVEQLEKLKQRSITGSERGRMLGSLVQKQRRIQRIEQSKKYGKKLLGKLVHREFFLVGIALYWAEGCKKVRKVHFSNSDPRMINFMIEWLEMFLGIKKDRLIAVVGINVIHKQREEIVKTYWVKTTGIPLSQFRKTSFKHTKAHKVYENFDNHYGTLSIEVLKPAEFYYKILGLVEGLAECQRSSRVERSFHKR